MKIQGLGRFYNPGLKMATSARSSRDSIISMTVLGGKCSLQNMPQSVTVHELRRYSCWIWQAGSWHMMSYVMSKISRKVRLLCWNHMPHFMDLDSEHLTPATFFRHRHIKPSGILGSADHVISGPRVSLHLILKQAHVLQKLHSEALIAEQVREKIPVRTTVFPHGMSI